jgi:hypothetical protein
MGWILIVVRQEKLTVGKCFGVDHFSKFTDVLTCKISSTYTPAVQKEVLIREHLANAGGIGFVIRESKRLPLI